MAVEKLTGTPPLTAKLIESARAKEADYELRDPAAPGLCLRVSPKGAKVFRWYLTSLKRVITIGRWAKTPTPQHVTLAEARSWLERLKEAYATGRLDEVVAELQALRPPKSKSLVLIEGGPLTVRQVSVDFLKYLERRRRRPEQARRPIELHVLPVIGDMPIAAVTARDCRKVVEGVVGRGSTTQAGTVLALMKQLFRFAQGRDDISQNPAYPLDREALGAVKNVSQRFLTAEEITAFWKSLEKVAMTPTVRNGLRILLLVGVRSGELLQATLNEIDFDAATWTIPVTHQKLTLKREKTSRPFVVPLAPAPLKLFEELRALAESVRSPNVMASFHAGGEQITDKALNHAMRRLFVGQKAVLSFPGERPTPHDLRRTMRTHLGEALGVPWHIAERCLNHSLGTITSTYDVGDYVAERRVALEKWAAYVEQLVAAGDAKSEVGSTGKR